MKKMIAILLTLACLFACVGAGAEADVGELIISSIEAAYGEPTELSYSLLSKMYNTTVPSGALTYIVAGSTFFCEYYDGDGTAHVWACEEDDVTDCMQQAFDAAEALEYYYTAFVLVIVGEDGSKMLMLIPWMADSSLKDGLYNDCGAFREAAMERLEKLYPDAVQTSLTIPGPESYLGVSGVSSVFDAYTEWTYKTEAESYEAMRAYAQMLADKYGFTVASLPEEGRKGLLFGETERTFVDIGIAGDGTYIFVSVSRDITLVPSEF